MEDIAQYVRTENTILVAVLFCIGKGLKGLERFPNQLIPLTVTGCGIALSCLSVVSRFAEYANWAAALFDGLVQGVLCSAMAVYVNEVAKHCKSGSCPEAKE